MTDSGNRISFTLEIRKMLKHFACSFLIVKKKKIKKSSELSFQNISE